MKINWKALIIAIAIPIAVGLLSNLIVGNSMILFESLNKPALAPPGIVFPIVWSTLYLLMGISTYLIWQAEKPGKQKAFVVYGLQLFVNFLWPILFFKGNLYLVSFLWLVLLWGLIVGMIYLFAKISKPAAYLQIPYLLWVTFAGYLNFMIYLLN